LWEEGANSFQPNTKLLQVAKDMGLIDELVLANASLPRFIFWNGKLNKLPTSVREFRHTKLISSRGKIRLLAGLMGAVGPCRAEGDESIEEFATRHFGIMHLIDCYYMESMLTNELLCIR
jgi:oxygen-dependent protoporphyrinogen oxidase